MKKAIGIRNIPPKSLETAVVAAKEKLPPHNISPASKVKYTNSGRLAFCYFLLITSTVFGFGGFGFGLGLRYTHLWHSNIFSPNNSLSNHSP